MATRISSLFSCQVYLPSVSKLWQPDWAWSRVWICRNTVEELYIHGLTIRCGGDGVSSIHCTRFVKVGLLSI